MIQQGIAPTTVPDLDKMAAILEIPMEKWEDHMGGPLPFQENKDNSKTGDRKSTRRESNSQEQDRRRINPGGKRADRLRKSGGAKR